MGFPFLLYGKSGSGKSRSLKGFGRKDIFYVNVSKKQLPFRSKFDYTICEDDTEKIILRMKQMVKQHPEVKTYIVDDFGYTLANEFMREHSKGCKGNQVFDLYNRIGDRVAKLIFYIVDELPADVVVCLILHEDIADDGTYKLRLVGKLVENYIVLEGRVTTCIRCVLQDGEHKFLCNHDNGITKSPEEMLPDEMPNDLKEVVDKIREYYGIGEVKPNEET